MNLDTLKSAGTLLANAGVSMSGGAIGFTPESIRELGELAPAILHDIRSDAVLGSALGWATEWVRCGLPQVSLGHKLASSLMATSMGKAGLESLRPPWKAFAVLLPSPLLSATTASGRVADVRVAHALWDDGHLRVVATGDGGIWSTSRTEVGEWAEEWTASGPESSLPTQASLDDHDTRMLRMLARLVLGVAAELSSADNERGVRVAERKSRSNGLGRDGLPKAWTFQLARPVRIDVRETVREYVERGGKSPTVQSLVRGHWKWQAHGKELQLRKWIHVEPYWRGPEDAPIVVSPKSL